MSFICPKCKATSYHPEDERYGYCGNCHEFTGDYGYGHERHSSSSIETQPDGPMQLREANEKTEAQLSKMQGYGQDYSVRELRGSGVGYQEQQAMREMRGDGMPLVKPTYKPNVFRYYLGAISVGFACGISWTSIVVKYVKSPYVYQALYSVVAIAIIVQAIFLYYENKRLNVLQAEIDKNWEELIEKYPYLKDTPR